MLTWCRIVAFGVAICSNFLNYVLKYAVVTIKIDTPYRNHQPASCKLPAANCQPITAELLTVNRYAKLENEYQHGVPENAN
jgi:hypothetical protein